MTVKKKVITTAAAAVILAASLVSMNGISGSLDSQNMAQRWQSGELNYSQVSVFYPAGKNSYGLSETESIGADIENKIKEGSFKPENDDAQVWTYAYSSVLTEASVTVYNEATGKTDTVSGNVNIMGTGGDFFEFHPLELVSGNYIYENELRYDRAVLDENAAWNIFSSADVTGMKFSINGTEFEVAGVVRSEDNSAVRKAYPETPLIYVHYDALEEAGADESLLCYEAVLPEPVGNFARNIILEHFGINTMTEPEDGSDPEKSLKTVVTDNTSRYSVKKLWNGLRRFDTLAVSDRNIAYPYWENAARINGVHMEFLFFAVLFTSAYILLMIIITAAKLYLNRKWHLKDFLEDMMYKYTYKKRTSDYISLEDDDKEQGKKSRYEQ